LLVLSAATLVIMSPSSSTDTNVVAVGSGTESPGTPQMRAYLDPETGELTVGAMPASADELDAELQNALRYDDEGLQNVKHPNGAVSVNLQGRYQSVSVVHLDENGKFAFCTDDVTNVQRAVNNEVSNPATPEVK